MGGWGSNFQSPPQIMFGRVKTKESKQALLLGFHGLLYSLLLLPLPTYGENWPTKTVVLATGWLNVVVLKLRQVWICWEWKSEVSNQGPTWFDSLPFCPQLSGGVHEATTTTTTKKTAAIKTLLATQIQFLPDLTFVYCLYRSLNAIRSIFFSHLVIIIIIITTHVLCWVCPLIVIFMKNINWNVLVKAKLRY